MKIVKTKKKNQKITSNLYIERVKELDQKTQKIILDIEKEAFNEGAIHSWVLAPFIISQNVLFMKKDDDVLGMAIFLKDFNKDEVFFFSFAILNKFQGKGYGRYFFDLSVKYIFENNLEVSKINLTVDPLKPNNINMFTKTGFSKQEYFKDFYGNGVDRIYMTINREDIL